MEQRSEEWFAARLGIPTASRYKDLLAKTKSGYSTSRQNYVAQLVCERLTGKREESYQNAAMQWGTEQEPFARMALEARGIMVEEVGFVRHPTIDTGCSPDGLIDADGMVEIKCPITATHIDTLLNGFPSGHVAQVQGQMWVCDRQWCDFVSYDPRLPKGMDFFVDRIDRDQAYIDTLETEVCKFLNEINDTIATLQEKAK